MTVTRHLRRLATAYPAFTFSRELASPWKGKRWVAERKDRMAPQPAMTSDPGLSQPPETWAVRLAVAYLRLIRYAVACHILPPTWAMRLTAPYRRTASQWDGGP